MKKINSKVLLSIGALVVLLLISVAFKSEFKDMLRWLLETDLLRYFLICSVGIIFCFIKESGLNDVPLFKTQIAKPLDIFLTIGTYVTVISTSLNLLKGAYIQEFYGDKKYFLEFEKLDIYTLIGVAGLLLWYVIFHSTRMLGEVLYQTVDAEKIDDSST